MRCKKEKYRWARSRGVQRERGEKVENNMEDWRGRRVEVNVFGAVLSFLNKLN